MQDEFSKMALMKFLDYLAEKGLMNAYTVSSRKAAVNTVLGALPDEDTADVRKLNMDEVERKFSNLQGTNFKPDSIRVYKSRVAGSIADFVQFRQNPAGFKPKIKQQRSASDLRDKKNKEKHVDIGASHKSQDDANDYSGGTVSFPIPIRQGVIVKIVGVPPDLTRKEAQKIGNVIAALAIPEEEAN
jgi:hypothetical protein